MGKPTLYSAGYGDSVVLIRPRDKAPAHAGWLHNRPTKKMAQAWPGNFGIIAEKYPAIDIDLHDEKLAEQIVKWALLRLGPAPLRLSHRPASKLLVYRTDTPFKKKVLTLPEKQGKVEILGAGRQYLVWGIHPKGTPYRWAKKALWDIPPAKLTDVTEVQVDAFLDELQKEFGGFVGRSSKTEDYVTPPEELAAPSIEHVREVLRAMPNSDAFLTEVLPEHAAPRDYWVAMGMAIKGAAGDAGEDLFVEWTSRWEDGSADLEDAHRVYQGLQPERYGWPLLDRIAREHLFRIDAVDEFEAEDPPPPTEEETLPWAVQYSDEYVSDRMAVKLRDRLLFAGNAWMVWDGKKWVVDATKDDLLAERPLRQVMREFAEKVLEASFHAPDAQERQQLRSRAKTLMNRGGMRTILEHIRVPLWGEADEFNANPMLLNTPGGLVDLETGDCRPTTPADRVSNITNVAPAVGPAPHWIAFLNHLTGGNRETEKFLKRYMGYCLTGRMDEKVFVFAWGSNHDTGKSTFVKAVSYAMGSYAHSDDVNFLLGGMSENRRAQAVARMFGSRLLTCTEPSAGRMWDDETIKKITGRDVVTARFLFKEPFDYAPQFKILLAGNHEPELRVVDRALLRRIIIAPMNNQVPPAMMDKQLDTKLQAEAPQILQWMIDGCLAWQRDGLNPPAEVLEATEEYRESEDILAQWCGECCERGEDLSADSQVLYDSWAEWCQARNRKVSSYIAFARALNARATEWGLAPYRTADSRGMDGIRVRPRVELGTEFPTEES